MSIHTQFARLYRTFKLSSRWLSKSRTYALRLPVSAFELGSYWRRKSRYIRSVPSYIVLSSRAATRSGSLDTFAVCLPISNFQVEQRPAQEVSIHTQCALLYRTFKLSSHWLRKSRYIRTVLSYIRFQIGQLLAPEVSIHTHVGTYIKCSSRTAQRSSKRLSQSGYIRVWAPMSDVQVEQLNALSTTQEGSAHTHVGSHIGCSGWAA